MEDSLNFKVGDLVKIKSSGSFGQIVRLEAGDPEIYVVEVGAARFWCSAAGLEIVAQSITSYGPLTWTDAVPATRINATMDGFWIGESDSEEKKKLREQRKKEGRCQECGDLLPMSIHGLLDCPKHPSAPPAKQ